MPKPLRPWRRISELCVVLHRLMYVTRDLEAARAHLPELTKLLNGIPRNTVAILAAEARAIRHELRGKPALALALLGQARWLRTITPDQERETVSKLLTRWAMHRALGRTAPTHDFN